MLWWKCSNEGQRSTNILTEPMFMVATAHQASAHLHGEIFPLAHQVSWHSYGEVQLPRGNLIYPPAKFERYAWHRLR